MYAEPEPQVLTAAEEPVSAEKTTEHSEKQGLSAAAFSLSAEEFYRRQIPGILIDQNSYAPEEEKIAVFCGKALPAVFEIRRDDTDETVWSGELRPRTAEGELQIATGDFSAFAETGRYYLYAQRLGESCAFSVEEEARAKLLRELLKRYYFNRCGISLTEEFAGEHAHGVCHSALAYPPESADAALDVSGGWHMDEQADRFVSSGAEIVENLLLAYELNPQAFGDASGIPESGNGVPDVLDETRVEVSWLLKMQDARTGGVYAAALTQGAEDGNLLSAPVSVQPVTQEATIVFAAALAKFAYHYRRFDAALATTCLRAADRAFMYYQYAAADLPLEDAAFAAAAELYRATGGERYAEVLAQFFHTEDFYARAMWEPPLFFGAVTYLQTGQAIDVGAADGLMRALTSAAAAYADEAKRTVYGASFAGGAASADGEETADGETAGDDARTVGRLLHGMRLLAVCDHVSYSYEYTRLLQEQLHALCGRNPDAKNYLTGFSGDGQMSGYPGIVNQPVENASLAVSAAMLLSEGK